MIFVSSTGVYGQSAGEWVDEDSATEPGSFTGRIVLEAERRVLDGPFPGTAVRFGGIYGPGRTRLLERVRAGAAQVPAGRPVYTNRIHRDDCAGALTHLLARDRAGRPLEPVYLGVDHEPAELGEVFRFLAEILGAAPPKVAADADTGRRGSNKRCRNDRLLATGYRFLYPTYREGYRALVEGA
jgi:nucleoside-diphosphate-sugar epimerase